MSSNNNAYYYQTPRERNGLVNTSLNPPLLLLKKRNLSTRYEAYDDPSPIELPPSKRTKVFLPLVERSSPNSTQEIKEVKQRKVVVSPLLEPRHCWSTSTHWDESRIRRIPLTFLSPSILLPDLEETTSSNDRNLFKTLKRRTRI